MRSRLGIAGAAAMLVLLGDGLFWATSWGLNAYFFAPALVILRVALASLSTDAFYPLSGASAQPPDPNHRDVEADLRTRRSCPERGDQRPYKLSRSRAREPVEGLRIETGAGTQDPREGG